MELLCPEFCHRPHPLVPGGDGQHLGVTASAPISILPKLSRKMLTDGCRERRGKVTRSFWKQEFQSDECGGHVSHLTWGFSV